MKTIQQLREHYPAFRDLSDEQLVQIQNEVRAFGQFFARLALERSGGLNSDPSGSLSKNVEVEYDGDV